VTAPAHVFTVVDGLRLHHLDYGGTGSTIALIHGVLGNAWMWHGMAERLTEHGHVVAVDLRSYGDSQWSLSGGEPTTAYASDLAALAEIHHWGPLTIVGFSLGGLVGLALWDRDPAGVDRLVMVDLPPASQKSEADVPPIQMAVMDQSAAIEAERRNLPHAPDSLIHLMASQGYRPGDEGLVRKHHPSIAERWRFRSEDWWHVVDRLDRPLLFVHAPDGGVCSLTDATEVSRRAQFGSIATVLESGHLIPLEQPEEFGDVVVEFLGGTVR
jgi:pimeloyl-ACP methyl ester carboxylesterase